MGTNGEPNIPPAGTVLNFRGLRVWHVGMELVDAIYSLTKSFPRHELYGLAGQLQRAAVSVPSNLAEGHMREHSREFLRHVSIAHASLAELETQIEIATRVGYITDDQSRSTLAMATSLGRQLFALRNSLIRKVQSES